MTRAGAPGGGRKPVDQPASPTPPSVQCVNHPGRPGNFGQLDHLLCGECYSAGSSSYIPAVSALMDVRAALREIATYTSEHGGWPEHATAGRLAAHVHGLVLNALADAGDPQVLAMRRVRERGKQ